MAKMDGAKLNLNVAIATASYTLVLSLVAVSFDSGVQKTGP